MTTEQAFGIVLREIRVLIGISQEELALKSGFHRTYISMLERGLKNPSLTTIFRLCSALDTKPNELIILVSQKINLDPTNW